MLDLNTKEGQHAEKRLRSDIIGWLTTVSASGRPYTVPVWFLWDNNSILVFSQPQKQKVRNLPENPRVTLALDDTNEGGDVVIVEGTGELINDPAVTVVLPAFREKYATQLQNMGWTPEKMANDYSQAIRITPTKIRSWE
jgi:PPOX class probable F420-dependent enzyme